ncbi:hypothetical protein OG909_32765 (plasmid) [Streptomyces sp. NBC_01754]|uniref:hypothetical protein n=1 Tax=Streptomyces sp. NBC_01754 TaxID=2975930 RepID=UPI002DD9547C|nr:hypothetical protein [Streptomyces sp. NBC_01754]WSC97079.1 hypothetical protein OG909_32765 [Streptomyces sp. NBC_01754]
MTLNLDLFRDQHGDPTQWSTADIDTYLVIGEIAPPDPPLHSYSEMQAIAAVWAREAEVQQSVADRLLDQGHETAAGIWARGAREAREYAAAARYGYPHYEAVLNGW